MKAGLFTAIAVLGYALALPQGPPRPPSGEDQPSMKRSQIEQLLKEDHRKSVEDAGQLAKLAEELKIELEKGDRHVLSLAAVKKTEEIEKLAKRIRSRLRRF
jgi:ATP-dependent helicase/DNAse subunit B